MLNITAIQTSNIEYREEVLVLTEKAVNYLKSFHWCQKVIDGWLINDFGFMLCIYRFKIEPAQNSGADDDLWIIVGDLPSAYLDTIEYKSANDALGFYCYLMKEWIDNVRAGKSVDECYPINVPPTIQWANELESRVKIIESDFLPYI